MSGHDKLAIHTVPSVTLAGYECKKWCVRVIFIGLNPLGPRGGKSGIAVAARHIGGTFRSHEAALKYIQSDKALSGLEVV